VNIAVILIVAIIKFKQAKIKVEVFGALLAVAEIIIATMIGIPYGLTGSSSTNRNYTPPVPQPDDPTIIQKPVEVKSIELEKNSDSGPFFEG
jgi:hypothetical protein